jgi:hypothetical protein
LLAKGVVRALGVVEDQPVGELAVEEGEVGEEQILVVIHEGLLDRSIESSAWRSSSGFWGRYTSV